VDHQFFRHLNLIFAIHFSSLQAQIRVMAAHRNRRRRGLFSLVLLPLLLLLMAAVALASDKHHHPTDHEQEADSTPPPAEGAAVPASPDATRWRGPFASPTDMGWILAAAMECVGLGAYYFWGGAAPQEQQQAGALAADGGGGGLLGFLPEWMGTLWAQHWPDIQQHLPAPWGLLAAHWQAHGTTFVMVVAVAAALLAAGVGGWMVLCETERIAARPGCLEHMRAAGRGEGVGDGGGTLPWWALHRRAWAVWQAKSTGPCSDRSMRLHLYSPRIARPFFAVARIVAWVDAWTRWAIMCVSVLSLLAAAVRYFWGSWQEVLEVRRLCVAWLRGGGCSCAPCTDFAYVFPRVLSSCMQQRRLLRVGWPGAGEHGDWREARGRVVRSESVDRKEPSPLPVPPPPPPPAPLEEGPKGAEEAEEEEEDKAAAAAAVAFGKKQVAVHQLLSVLGKACATRRAQQAVATYDGAVDIRRQ
jgi:hypothetical protein